MRETSDLQLKSQQRVHLPPFGPRWNVLFTKNTTLTQCSDKTKLQTYLEDRGFTECLLGVYKQHSKHWVSRTFEVYPWGPTVCCVDVVWINSRMEHVRATTGEECMYARYKMGKAAGKLVVKQRAYVTINNNIYIHRKSNSYHVFAEGLSWFHGTAVKNLRSGWHHWYFSNEDSAKQVRSNTWFFTHENNLDRQDAAGVVIKPPAPGGAALHPSKSQVARQPVSDSRTLPCWSKKMSPHCVPQSFMAQVRITTDWPLSANEEQDFFSISPVLAYLHTFASEHEQLQQLLQ